MLKIFTVTRITAMITTIIIIVCLIDRVYAVDIVPVFVIDEDNVLSTVEVQSNPFARTSPREFTAFLSKIPRQRTIVIIFVEDQFCTEDISAKDSLGTPFYYLHQGVLDRKVKYFPAVASAVEVLNEQFEPLTYNEMYLESPVTKMKITNDNMKYSYAYFLNSANETKTTSTTTLRKHDALMKQACNVLRQMYKEPVVAIYTGKTNPVDIDAEKKKFQSSLKKPQNDISDPDVIFLNSNTTIFEFRGMQLPKGRRLLQRAPSRVEETYNRSAIHTKLYFGDVQLEFNFQLTERDWALDTIKMYEEEKEVAQLRTSVRAPWGYSCSNRETIVLRSAKDGSVLTIPRYQVEPVKEWLDRKPSLRKGGHPFYFRADANCGPFFSEAIMMGLFVVGILLIILFYGITSVMDVCGNSRFDRAGGKQLMYADTGIN